MLSRSWKFLFAWIFHGVLAMSGMVDVWGCWGQARIVSNGRC